MSSHRHQLLSTTKSKYFKFKQRLEKNISTGRFDELSRKKKNSLVTRLEKFRNRLEKLNFSTREMLVAGSVVTVAVLPNTSTAQIDPNIYLKGVSTIAATSPNDIAAANIDMDEELEVIIATSTGGIIAQWDGKDSYSPSTISELSDARDVIMAGDIDGDDDIDLIFTYDKTGTYFYKAINNGFGDFTSSPIGQTNNATDVDLVDWDSDGDLDVAVASNGNSFEILENDGSGNFTDLGSISLSGYEVRNIEFADLDNDGDLDLLHVGYSGPPDYNSSVFALENTTVGPGTPTFDIMNPAIVQQTASGTRYDGIVAFDFDGDGDLDIFSHRQFGPYTEVKQNNFIEGTPFDFTDITVSYISSAGNIQDAIAADFDNDGTDELILAGASFNRLLSFDAGIMQGNGGNLGGEVGELTGNYEEIFVEDLNNDGNLDLVVTEPGNNQAQAFHDDAAPQISGFLGDLIVDENSPVGTSIGTFFFNDRQSDPITTSLTGPDADFFNFDPGTGELTINSELDWETKGSDIQVAMELSDDIKSRVTEFVIKMRNLPEQGNGTFDPESFKLIATREVNFFLPGDYDMDGDTDLFVTSPQSPFYNSMLQQNQGTFGDIPVVTLSNYQEEGAFINSYGGLDLLVHDPVTDELRVVDNNGGDFSTPEALYTGIIQVNRMVTGDFDGDGLFEVAVQAETTDNSEVVLTFEEDGGGLAFNQSFLMSNRLGTGLLDAIPGVFKTIAIADFDGDDFADLLAVSTDGDDVIFRGGLDLGGGNYGFNSTFTPAITQSDGGESEVEVGDLDGDGSTDIAIMRWENNVNYQIHVDLHMNDGAGSFSLDQTIPLGGEFWGNLKLADIDADGSLDIVTSNLKAVDLGGELDISMSIETFENDGSGTFSLFQSIEDVGGENFKMADIDGDDDLDIIIHGDIAAPIGGEFQLSVFRNVNVSPTAINLSSTSMDEHLPLDTEVATISIDDLNAGDTHIVSLVTGDGLNDLHNSFFSVNGNSLRITKDVSFETTPNLNIYLSVNDGHQTYEEAIVISVNDINVAPTGINLSVSSFDEGTVAGSQIATISAVDLNVGDSHVFDFATGDGINDADNGSFIIDGDRLIVTDETVFETKSVYNIYLSATDIDNSVEQAIVLTVNDIDQIPTSIALSSTSFDEGIAPGSEIATISAIDANVGDVHTFEFATGNGTNDADNGFFVINGDKLIITANSKFEDKPTYNIYLTAIDDDGSVEEAIVLNVNDINQAPTGISLSATSFDEGTTPGTAISTLSAIDANVGDTHTFAFSTGDGINDADNGSFILSGNTLIVNAVSSFETQSSYNIYLSVEDDQGSVEEAIVLNVNDINQAPTGISLSAISFDERTTPGTVVSTLSAIDANVGDTHTFSFATGDGTNDADNGSFIVSGNNLIVNTVSRFETQPSYNIYLSVEDDQGSFEQGFLIGVNNVNEAPTVLTLSNATLSEDTPSGTVIGSISVTDPDVGDSHQLELATGDGTNDANNDLFVISGNNLVLLGNVDFNTNPTLSILIAANDGDESYQQSFELTVNNALGLKDELSNELGIYPNPGKGRLGINLDNSQRGHFVIRISDLSGKIVYRYEGEKRTDKWTRQIDMTKTETGIYIVEVSFPNRKFTQRWIKE